MIYVTSDLHGIHPDEFRRLLRRAEFSENDYLFILGDVIDRGEHGAELLLWLTEQPNISLILGNHEALMLVCRFLFDEVTAESLDNLTLTQIHLVESWIHNGGGPTIQGLHKLLKRNPDLMEGILEYLQDAPLYESVEVNGRKFVLVHSGLGHFSESRPLHAYSPEDCLLTRPDLTTRYFSDATVIFGHTPTALYGEEHKGKPIYTDTWICIDTGVHMGHSPMLLRLDDMKEFY